MDCSLREAWRKEQSIAPPKNFFSDPSGQRKGQISLHKSSFGGSKTARFFAAQRMVLLMFYEDLYFEHFLSFCTMQLELPKPALHALFPGGSTPVYSKTAGGGLWRAEQQNAEPLGVYS